MHQAKTKTCLTCGTENTLYAPSCTQCGRRLREVLLSESDLRASAEPSLDVPATTPMLGTFKGSLIEKPLKLYRRKWFVLATFSIILVVILLATFILRYPGMPTSSFTVLPLPNGLGEVRTSSGQNIGINDGSFAPFDTGLNPQEITFKQQAMTQLKNGNSLAAIALWKQALSVTSNDAETLIYLEDQLLLASGKPYVTLVASTAFTPPFPDTQYDAYLQGIYVAQHEFNSGNHAFLLRILIANAGNDINNTTAVAKQIVQVAQKDATIIGVIGWLNSSDTLNALDTFTRAKLPMISPQASSDYLAGISPYFFRIVPPNKIQAQAAAQFMKNVLHIKSPVVFVDHTDAYSQNLAQDFENAFSAGGHLPEESFTADNTKSFAPLIQNALQYHPDAFYFTSPSSVDAGLFQDALPITGLYATIPAIAGDGGYVIHKNGYGRWYFTEYAYHGENTLPIAQRFALEYIADFNPGPHPQKPAGFYGYSLANDHSILAYDATSLVLAALQMANTNGNVTLTPQVLANTLPFITGANAFQGVSGQIAFGPDHDPINKAIVILYTSKDGHIQLYNIQGCLVKGCA
jgi:eukaryotic-like serine/threonine-protein kinase